MIAERIRDLFPENVRNKVYIGELPTDVNECVAITEAGGPHDNYFNRDQMDTPYVKITVRHPQFQQGYNLIRICKDLLSSYSEPDPFGLILVGDIMYFGRDDQRRNMWQLTFKIYSYYKNT